ncbi:MAG TPA: hypothetical protein VGG39_19925 [Polyangiaceae bacterium]|jgi:hypothetical protein
MRRGTAAALAALSLAMGVTMGACVDLFHATSDILTACELDASTPGCTAPDAGSDARQATDFCSWDSTTARANAEHACAWLGACESPLGSNAYGSCMFQALLTYDCGVNPSHPARGKTHAAWDCLWRAQSCSDIEACVFPSGRESCGNSGGTACGIAGSDGGPSDLDTRIECLNGATNGESCAMWGQTCFPTDAGAFCRASSTSTLGTTCYECDGTVLHECSADAGDFGIDCVDYGAGTCGGFPAGDAGWLACVPSGDSGTCPASKDVTCTAGIARSCPAGLPEAIDCGDLLQSAAACNAGALATTDFDWTSPCFVPLPEGDDAGDAGPCAASCSGSQLTDCYRNARFELDCHEAGLGACHMVTTDIGAQTRPACGAP